MSCASTTSRLGADSVDIASAALTETACNGFSSGRFLTIGPLIVEIFGFGDAMPRVWQKPQ
jgi:hypothetical protein